MCILKMGNFLSNSYVTLACITCNLTELYFFLIEETGIKFKTVVSQKHLFNSEITSTWSILNSKTTKNSKSSGSHRLWRENLFSFHLFNDWQRCQQAFTAYLLQLLFLLLQCCFWYCHTPHRLPGCHASETESSLLSESGLSESASGGFQGETGNQKTV